MPQLPRRSTTNRRTREAIENAAFEIGLVIAIQRNRKHWNQSELAQEVGRNVTHNDISRIERGAGPGLTDRQIDKLFEVLDLGEFEMQREFLKWWQ
jgi:ribosome-binding protein aMBF1 (putative translation factor)